MTLDKDGDLFTIEDLAALFEVTKATVFRWNTEGTGPKRIQIGKRVYYRKADVTAWIDAREAKA